MKNLSSFGVSLLLPLVIFLSSLSVAHSQEDDFKAAGIDMQRVFQEYYKTSRTERNINEKRIQIQKVDRKARMLVKNLKVRILEETRKWEDLTISEEEKTRLSETVARLTSEEKMVNQERLRQLQQSESQLNRDMMRMMLGLLDEIRRFVEAHADRSEYDIVFDTSGTSTNQTPPVLGGKGIRDITATVIAELNRDDPALKEKQ